MKKIKNISLLKRVLSCIMAAILLFGSVPAYAYEDEASSLKWFFNGITGNLRIRGSGDMFVLFDGESYPWFEYKDEIKSVTIEKGVTTVSPAAFEYCTNLERVKLPSTLITVEAVAFLGCENLESIDLPDGVKKVGVAAFAACTELKSVSIGKNVEDLSLDTVGELRSFLSCDKIESFTVDSENKYFSSVNGVLFNKDKTKLIQYPAGKKDEEYTVPESVVEVGDESFKNAVYLKNINMPEGIEKIGTNVFENCGIENNEECWDNGILYVDNVLVRINKDEIKNGIVEVKDGTVAVADVFDDSIITKKLVIPKSVKSIGTFMLLLSEDISIDSQNMYFTEENEVVYNKNRTSLIAYSIFKTEKHFDMPDSVESIEPFAFYGSNIESVELSANIKNIGMQAFATEYLRTIKIGDKLEKIDKYAFYSFGLERIVYEGSEKDWELIEVGEGNDILYECTLETKKLFEEENGIVASFDENCFERNEDVFLCVEEIEEGQMVGDGDFYKVVDGAQVGLFDISIKYKSDNEKAKISNGKVKLRIPLEKLGISSEQDIKEEDLMLVHRFDTGDRRYEYFFGNPQSPSHKKLDIVNGYIVLEVDCFSDFIVFVKCNIQIREPSVETVSYGDSLVLHADFEGVLPEGGYIKWTADNECFTITASADGETCTVSPEASGSTVFTATVYDADGTELAKDEQTLTAKAGIFVKIIAFFKKLFGLTKIIPEALKTA